MSEPIKAFKGFNKNWQCRGYQYKVGESYTHEGKIQACKEGFHACTYPLDVFNYYEPAASRYAVVLMDGETSTHDEDSKIAAARITIEAEITIPQMVKSAIEWIMGQIKGDAQVHATDDHSHASNTGYHSAASNTGDYSAASNTGDYSAASNTGYYSAASNTGNYSAASNTGYHSAASNTGYHSAASNTGDYSAASNTGYYSAASNTGHYSAASNTGYRSAASNTGNYSAASNTGHYSAASNTGYRSAASNTGYYSAASNTGDRSAASVEGKHSVAMASGYKSRAKACEGSAIVLCYRDDDFNLVHIRAGIAGKDVQANTWYRLNEQGEFVEDSEV